MKIVSLRINMLIKYTFVFKLLKYDGNVLINVKNNSE